ncbi:poly(A) RNA polymerase, mitochondrial-like [Chironomus tepperi]|uniref:poly(A) RNA polymerase, mitochondrial-like n=1 Tax=Chironomus tepperi TaxID=113505 RepID=UPI00391F781E
MSYNRYGYMQGNDYQSNTSQGYNYGYQQQSQGWYTDQGYMEQVSQQNYNNGYSNTDYKNQLKFPNYKYQQYPINNQMNNSAYPQQQQQQQYIGNYQKWGKRSHDYVEQSPQSTTASPEPRRQVLKNNFFQNPNMHAPQYSQSFQHAAYQTPNTPNLTTPQYNRNKGSPNKKNPNAVSPVVAIQEQRSTEWAEIFKETMTLLNGCKAGEEVNILISYLQPPRSAWVKTKKQIYNDLMSVLAPLNVEKLLVFGSTLTGLDFHGSDLDYSCQLKIPPSNDEEIRQLISKTAKLTRYFQGYFQIICIIQNARVPIIRLLHTATKITCDVNFTSQFGYYNSYFIGHVLGYDKRIKDIAVILKLWSKTQKLAQQLVVSNYCLLMLLIFYLQNLENPLLDTIINNQRSRSPLILDTKYKWNFYFNDTINKTKDNQSSVRELLVGFFEFYDKLNYNEYVVSLYTGNLITRKSFNENTDLEEYRNIVNTNDLTPLRADSPGMFVVQDGFELNINIGIKNRKHTATFFELIKMSYKKCEELKDKPFAELLIKLFTDIPLPKVENESRGKNKKQFQMTIHSTAGDLKACQDILLHENPSKIYSVEDQHKLFYEHVLEYTQKFLKECYLCTVIPELSEEPSNSNPMHTRLHIVLQYDTINGRKKMNFKDDESVGVEQTLSSKMLEKKIAYDLDCYLVIFSRDQGKSVSYDMFDSNNVSKKSSLSSFGNYFSINIATALKFYLKKRWDMATITN